MQLVSYAFKHCTSTCVCFWMCVGGGGQSASCRKIILTETCLSLTFVQNFIRHSIREMSLSWFKGQKLNKKKNLLSKFRPHCASVTRAGHNVHEIWTINITRRTLNGSTFGETCGRLRTDTEKTSHWLSDSARKPDQNHQEGGGRGDKRNNEARDIDRKG